MRSGHYARSQTYKTPLPMVIGMEGIGTLSTGERVAYCITRGSYAEYAAVPAWKLVRVPDDVPSPIAVTLMLQGLPAHYLSHSAFPLAKGHTCLVHAAAGGLGYPAGPLAWGDRIGAGRMLELHQALYASTGDPRHRPTRWVTERARLGMALTDPGTSPADCVDPV